MTWLEWLVWKWDRRKARKVCERQGHDITGPHLTAGGWRVFTCTRCPYRISEGRIVGPR